VSKNSEKPIEVGATFQHYKGKQYKVLGLARHSETLEMMVYYECLYPNEMGQMWVRPIGLFTGFVEVDGVKTERFKKLTEPK
jgi:hypothetical protein